MEYKIMVTINEDIIKILLLNGFELVDEISFTYTLKVRGMVFRFQVNPIYCYYRFTLTQTCDDDFGLEWSDSKAVDIIKKFPSFVEEIPLFLDFEETEVFIKKYNAIEYYKDF